MDTLAHLFVIRYIDDGKACFKCCSRVAALAADNSIVTREQMRIIDAAVGSCEDSCVPSESHRYYDSSGKYYY
jgi:hypothetical protein